jgi:hypothetical protein
MQFRYTVICAVCQSLYRHFVASALQALMTVDLAAPPCSWVDSWADANPKDEGCAVELRDFANAGVPLASTITSVASIKKRGRFHKDTPMQCPPQRALKGNELTDA